MALASFQTASSRNGRLSATLSPALGKSSVFIMPEIGRKRQFLSYRVDVARRMQATNRLSEVLPFLKQGDKDAVKKELLSEIEPLDRGAAATEDDRMRIDKLAQKLEALNPTKAPLKSPLLNGKWELLYTTSQSILKSNRPKLLRPNGPIYQAINNDTLRAQNLETWPFFNQVTANLTPASSSKVVVNFDFFKIAGLIPIKAPGRARGELDVTYLDEDLRCCSVSRGDRGNLFVLKMFDRSYRVPTQG
ncbi:probable plastid-lipid-associated protein 4, chloroplastic isoform X1 [Selaginella moellendorffii]|uniref:probable plastid-lipid-associated protein 4, chloroplastic isoform X1 n=1 Tax=Selaginella moellendorffii TaxID=88036 RepID=UPI000D1C787F|nr:probable plastid-lipid-associated protein 4, chloroplastic isoform X1 [Selaginella moellendorffii]XP_024526789.1 probable plastid-lipid-associated protein 4, chloroplastic isoform X1 [Selaginella moellendorffii]|eukprot:XP_024526788.1 probable plastid-lipid-associated protein 4, chloroplastic isoform X1 [Selaginella moellendorffii]